MTRNACKNEKQSFWRWLGRRTSENLRLFCKLGGWIAPWMIGHAIILYEKGLSKSPWLYTFFLWFIPSTLTYAYSYYKEFVEEKKETDKP